MAKVKILVYDKFHDQLEMFINSFKKNHQESVNTYEFVVVSASVKPNIEGCICEELQPYGFNFRFSFLAKIEELLKTDLDLLIVADDRCFCLSSIDDFVADLENRTDWQLCGAAVNPEFDVNLLYDNKTKVLDTFVYVDTCFMLLNPKTIPSGLIEQVEQLMPQDVQSDVASVALNVLCDKKIILTKLFCNSFMNTYRFDYHVVLIDVRRQDADHLAGAFDDSFIFLESYLKESKPGELCELIKKLSSVTPSHYHLKMLIANRLISIQSVLNQNDEISFNK